MHAQQRSLCPMASRIPFSPGLYFWELLVQVADGPSLFLCPKAAGWKQRSQCWVPGPWIRQGRGALSVYAQQRSLCPLVSLIPFSLGLNLWELLVQVADGLSPVPCPKATGWEQRSQCWVPGPWIRHGRGTLSKTAANRMGKDLYQLYIRWRPNIQGVPRTQKARLQRIKQSY